MDLYEQLAEEMLSAMEEKRRVPPKDQVSNVMKGEMAVLRLLRNMQRHMSAGEISRELGMKTSRIAAVLNSLERKKMVCREDDPSDGRRVNVALTLEGERFCEERKRCAHRDMARMLEFLGEADAREFIRIMRRVNSAMAQLGERRVEQVGKEVLNEEK